MRYMKKNKILILLLLVFCLFTCVFNFNATLAAGTEYYSGINENLTGNSLKKSLRDLITTTHKYKSSYDDCKNPKIVEKTDGDPNKSGNIILFWSELSVSSAWASGDTWNREHVWPKSKAWYETSGAGSDLHHIRPSDNRVNTVHSNDCYGVVSGSNYVVTSAAYNSVTTKCKSGNSLFEPGDSKKGDTARIIFYLLTRYSEADNYSVTNVATSMDMLLEWNEMDPVDELEIRRNEAVYDIQGNRNPFIDNSDYANMIWDDNYIPDNEDDNEELDPTKTPIENFQSSSTYTSLMLSYNQEGTESSSNYSYTFNTAPFTSNGTKSLNGINWTLSGDGSYWGLDSNYNKGQQLGSAKKPYKNLLLKSDALQNVKSIKINTCGASDTNAKLTVKVGGVAQNTVSLTSTSNTYVFDNINKSGIVEFSYTQTSSKALYIKSIEIEYNKTDCVYTLNSASIRFGSYITKEMYDCFNEEDTVWGVEYYIGSDNSWNTTSIKTVLCTPAQVSAPNSTEIDINGQYYQFALVLTGLNLSHIDTKINARVFVEYEGVRYYMNQKSVSLRDVAELYLSSSDKGEFSEHLGILNYIKNYN